jgi:hypothetical protein
MEGASLAGDSEDDIDWEEIDVLQQNIEITLQASPRKDAIDSKCVPQRSVHTLTHPSLIAGRKACPMLSA